MSFLSTEYAVTSINNLIVKIILQEEIRVNKHKFQYFFCKGIFYLVVRKQHILILFYASNFYTFFVYYISQTWRYFIYKDIDL